MRIPHRRPRSAYACSGVSRLSLARGFPDGRSRYLQLSTPEHRNVVSVQAFVSKVILCGYRSTGA